MCTCPAVNIIKQKQKIIKQHYNTSHWTIYHCKQAEKLYYTE